jgi:hypothetical protein
MERLACPGAGLAGPPENAAAFRWNFEPLGRKRMEFQAAIGKNPWNFEPLGCPVVGFLELRAARMPCGRFSRGRGLGRGIFASRASARALSV